MARKPRLFAPGVLYHVIVRGNQRQKTFLKEQDYQVYLERLAHYRQRYGVMIYAYCLMPNHVHFCWNVPERRWRNSCRGCSNLIRNTSTVFTIRAVICFKVGIKLLFARKMHICWSRRSAGDCQNPQPSRPARPRPAALPGAAIRFIPSGLRAETGCQREPTAPLALSASERRAARSNRSNIGIFIKEKAD